MDEQIAEAPPRPRWKRPLIVAAVVVFVGIWAFGFWYDANRGTPEPLDAASAGRRRWRAGQPLARCQS